MWSIIAGILHLGNIELLKGSNDYATIAEDDPHLLQAARLFQVKPHLLAKSIVTKTIKVRVLCCEMWLVGWRTDINAPSHPLQDRAPLYILGVFPSWKIVKNRNPVLVFELFFSRLSSRTLGSSSKIHIFRWIKLPLLVQILCNQMSVFHATFDVI